jgi:hypothetical protein
VDKIRKRRDVKHVYYERWGPTVVSIGLLVIILVNFGLRARMGGFIAQPGPQRPGGERHGGEL